MMRVISSLNISLNPYTMPNMPTNAIVTSVKLVRAFNTSTITKAIIIAVTVPRTIRFKLLLRLLISFWNTTPYSIKRWSNRILLVMRFGSDWVTCELYWFSSRYSFSLRHRVNRKFLSLAKSLLLGALDSSFKNDCSTCQLR